MNGFRLSTLILVPIVAVTLSACSLVPDLAPESLAANKSACETLSSVWNDLTTVLQSGNLVESASTLGALPTQLESAISTSTDPALDEALTGLKTQLDAFVTTASPDLTQLASAGASLAARCTVFGVTPNLTLPGM